MKIFLSSLAFLLVLLGQAQNVDFKKKNFDSETDYNKAAEALDKGDDYFFAGNFEKALPRFLEAQKLNPQNALLNFKIGACYLKNDELKKSMPYFKTAKELDPKVDPKIDYALAQSYQANGRYDEAVESYHIYLAGLSKNKKVLEEAQVQKHIDICSTEIQKKQSRVEQEKKELAAKKDIKTGEKPTATTIATPATTSPETKAVAAVEKETPKAPVKEVKKEEPKPTKPIVTTPVAKDKITYRIQITSTSSPASTSDLAKIYSGSLKVSNQKVGSVYKYFIGDFNSKDEAMKARSLSGISDAFIVRFKNGKKI